ncbi:unnamed protein product [Allacma fusca]|uniref:Serpin domain-containing protein n=1 Tax=Allacma fusca TaxID=39272 RepID=A0A8J2K432_9HEXA|nr:unnamed protein product [Allacma fusca]
MKTDSFIQSSVYFLLSCYVVNSFAEIIGSSVVTSVSVVLGNENKDEVASTTPAIDIEDDEAAANAPNQKPEGVLSIMKRPMSTTNPVQSADETPPVSRLEEDSMDDDDDDDDEDDDDEDDDDEADDFVEVTLTVPTTTTEPPKVNVKVDTSENDTATSAEVNEAIHKISGALLTPGKSEMSKPLENIVTDVLTSINDARNSTTTTSTTTTPATTSTSTTTKTTTKKYTTTTTQPTSTTRKAPASVKYQHNPAPGRTDLLPTTHKPKPKPPTTPVSKTKTKPKMPEMTYSSSKLPGIQTDDNLTAESDTEEDFLMDEKVMTTTMADTPKTTRVPPLYSTVKRPNITSSSSNRPTDFYDDEIFGYDPYQTFLHGVYVPVKEVEEDNREGVATVNEAFMLPTTTMAPMRDPDHSHIANLRPNVPVPRPIASHVRKPVPSLPDYLHRPRPSHIQYQHGVAENVDPESGLLNIKRPSSPAPAAPEDNFAVDRLTSQPRPILPRPVVENYTNHHNDAHHGGGHGHGGHGAHGHDAHGHNAHGHDAHGHDSHGHHAHHGEHHQHGSSEKRPTFSPAPPGNPGLEASVTSADPEMRSFIDINNRLALRLFSSVTNPVSKSTTSYNNMVLSPFAILSSLSMMFLGARGSTAQQLDGLLQLDDMVTFNPHMLYNNITQSFLSQPNTAAALIRLLIADKSKGDVLEFFKTRIQHFYDARVEEADYKFAGHLAQSIINQMTRAQIQRHSYEMLNFSLPLKGPMSVLTSAFFDGQFSGSRDQSVDSMDFIHLASLGRRLIRVPAVAFKDSLRAAYDKELDATAVEIPYSTRELSLILLMPGRPGEFAIGGVSSLKTRLTLESWHSLMRSFYPRDPFKVVFPKFRHQSNLNLTYTMQRMGLTDMFAPNHAKFKGINGLSDLYIDQNMVHFAEFGTWEKLSDTLTESNIQQNKNLDLIRILRPHVREHYGNYGEPMTVNDWIFMSRNPSVTGQRTRSDTNPRPRSTNISQPHNTGSYSKVRQSRSQFKDALLSSFVSPSRTMSKIYYFRQEPTTSDEETVLRFERPFVYILRHNPTGMILMTGQYTEPVTEEL